MKISSLINDHGRIYSPYVGNLVNHLPMAQFALYKMTDDLGKVREFTEAYTKRANINPVKTEYEKLETIKECLGNRQLYEACLEIIKSEIEEKGMDQLITHVLNTYPLGVSSGLFHTIIRVGYSIEGVELEEELREEVARALAYYVTAYRAGGLLERKISGSNIIEETKKIIDSPHIKKLLKSRESRGQRIKALYEDEIFMDAGFVIEGNVDDKVEALLNLLIPAYINTESIVVLHCITGLHATLVLREYYKDFPKQLDILTTCILTHLLTVEELGIEDLELENIDENIMNMSWNEVFEKVSKSMDVHVLKMAYTCSELYKLYELPMLKEAALTRIE